MSDLQATLDAIDELAVHECGHCSKPLPADSESPDYCGPDCQSAWLAAKQEVIELVGYREPDDLPQHVDNQWEMRSPETTPARPDWVDFDHDAWWSTSDGIVYDLRVDTTRLQRAFDEMLARIWQWDMHAQATVSRGFPAGLVIVDELHHWQPRGILNTPGVTVEYNTTPISLYPDAPEPFGSDFDFEHRPARSLPDSPPPAVMPELPEVDWQAVVDRAMHRTELNRWRIMEQVRHDARRGASDPRSFIRITGV